MPMFAPHSNKKKKKPFGKKNSIKESKMLGIPLNLGKITDNRPVGTVSN